MHCDVYIHIYMYSIMYETMHSTPLNVMQYTVEHGYNELFYNEFMVITNLSLHPVVISVFHCSSFITKLWL